MLWGLGGGTLLPGSLGAKTLSPFQTTPMWRTVSAPTPPPGVLIPGGILHRPPYTVTPKPGKRSRPFGQGLIPAPCSPLPPAHPWPFAQLHPLPASGDRQGRGFRRCMGWPLPVFFDRVPVTYICPFSPRLIGAFGSFIAGKRPPRLESHVGRRCSRQRRCTTICPPRGSGPRGPCRLPSAAGPGI